MQEEYNHKTFCYLTSYLVVILWKLKNNPVQNSDLHILHEALQVVRIEGSGMIREGGRERLTKESNWGRNLLGV